VKKYSKIFFLEMTLLGVKTCRESEFDIFEAKKRFADSGKICVLKQKVAKMRFLPKKITFLRLFASKHRPSLNQERVFRFENVKFEFLACFYT
jgi:hypothetical protein